MLDLPNSKFISIPQEVSDLYFRTHALDLDTTIHRQMGEKTVGLPLDRRSLTSWANVVIKLLLQNVLDPRTRKIVLDFYEALYDSANAIDTNNPQPNVSVEANTAPNNTPSSPSAPSQPFESSSAPSQPFQPNQQIQDIYAQLQSLREVQSFHYSKIMEDKKEIALLMEKVRLRDLEIDELKRTVHRLEVGQRTESTSLASQPIQDDIPHLIETIALNTALDDIAREFDGPNILPLPLNIPSEGSQSDDSFERFSPHHRKTEEGNQAQGDQLTSQKSEVEPSPPDATRSQSPLDQAQDPLTQFKQEILTNLLALRIRIDQFKETHQSSLSDIESLKTQIEDMKSTLPLTRKDRQGLKWLKEEMNKLRTIQNNDVKNNLFFKDLLEKINERIKGMDQGRMASLLNNLNYMQGRLEEVEGRLKVQERRVEEYGDEKIRVREV